MMVQQFQSWIVSEELRRNKVVLDDVMFLSMSAMKIRVSYYEILILLSLIEQELMAWPSIYYYVVYKSIKDIYVLYVSPYYSVYIGLFMITLNIAWLR